MRRLTGQAAADAAKAAYDEAQSVIKFSGNKLKTWIAAALIPVPGVIPALLGAGVSRYFEGRNWSGKTRHEMITQWAQLARNRKWGNCGEYTSLAFEYLKGVDVGPIDFMVLTDGDHAFCVMGRPEGTDDRDAGTWGLNDVWIIDGWKKLLFEMTPSKFAEVVESHKYACWARYH